MRSQFNDRGLDVERFPALKGNRHDDNPADKTLGQLGCLKSHQAVVEDAIEKGFETILIFEDDVHLCNNFMQRLDFYTKALPNNWQTLYLGGTIFDQEPKRVSKHIHRNIQTYGAFSFILKRSVFLDTVKLYASHLHNTDDCHAEFIQKQYPSYIIMPFMVHVNYDVSDVVPGEKMRAGLFNRIHQYYQD